MHSAEAPVAAAAIGALGTVGSQQAERALAAFESAAPANLKPIVADARLHCAATLPTKQAAEIYRQYLKSPLPPQRMAAWAGRLRQQTSQRTAIVLEAIQAGDPAAKSVALHEARSGGGAELTAGLAATLEHLPAADKAAVIDVLAERSDASALPAILKVVGSREENVRRAAFAAIGRLGDCRQIDLLVRAASKEKEITQSSIRYAMTLLRGHEVDDRLKELAGSDPAEVRAEAMAVLAARGVHSAMPLLLRALDARDPNVQQAAISALRAIAGAKEYPELLRRALSEKTDMSRQRLQELLIALFGRSTAPQDCIGQLVAALPTASTDGKSLLLAILGATGDQQALDVLVNVLGSSDPELRKTAVRALAQWPDAAAVKPVMAVVRTSDQPTMKVLAIRTSLAILAREKALPNHQKAALFAELLELAPRADEKRLILAALPRAVCPQTLQLAVKLLADPQLANQAAAVIVTIASNRNPPAQIKAALEKASQVAKSPAVQNQIRQRMKSL